MSFGCDLSGAIRQNLKMWQTMADFAVKENKAKFGKPKKKKKEASKQEKQQQERAEKAKEKAFTATESTPLKDINLREKELSLNFSIMKETIEAGKGDQIDAAFLEIFANDLQEIEDKKAKAQFSSELQGLANRIYEAKEKVFFKPQDGNEKPFFGERMSLKTLADTYTPGAVKTGLEAYADSFDMRPIKGDGHCFFRAVAATVITTVFHINEKMCSAYIKRIKGVVDSLDSSELQAQFIKFQEILLAVSKRQMSVDQAINDQKNSDQLVLFLRKLACEYNKKHENEVFDSIIEAGDHKKEEYLRDMADMSKARYANHAEVFAIAQALGINIRVLHTQAAGKGDELFPDHLHFTSHEGEEDLFLIHRPGHFDLAIKK